MKKGMIILVILILVCVVVVFFEGMLTSFVSQGSVPSNVSVDIKYFSIEFSGNLSDGITFEEVGSVPATNVNATDNYNNVGSGSSLIINVSNDSSTNIDFCIKANGGLTDSSGSVISIGQETYSNSSSTSSAVPALSEETSLTTSYVKASSVVGPGEGEYYRFWLDVPSGTAAGSYNNSISFKGVETTASC